MTLFTHFSYAGEMEETLGHCVLVVWRQASQAAGGVKLLGESSCWWSQAAGGVKLLLQNAGLRLTQASVLEGDKTDVHVGRAKASLWLIASTCLHGWDTLFTAGTRSARLGHALHGWDTTAGTRSAQLGHALHGWDTAFTAGTRSAQLGHALHSWDTLSTAGTRPSQLGHALHSWDTLSTAGTRVQDLQPYSGTLSHVSEHGSK
ncbi:hypothetical protein E2P81_ATG05038 [Venturia nashicola]|uniref:Uncharacterized protein n=1 Tax=Venturia nashicola TaxID=86259 RepID=A0A4Z1P205_9PEZI|nr:hypothetical protein E6O75_ATG05165 [Venturia nashicola]TLD34873.1 hypothetical protein E2P81_ATG05038 [Venturia nashicola]